MNVQKLKAHTIAFLLVFLLAGVVNVISLFGYPFISAMKTCINFFSYIGLILYWLQSVRARLLPSRARSWILSAGWLMLLYMLLRNFKYRFAIEAAVLRYATYLFFVPMTLIPTIFMMTCLRIFRGDGQEGWNEELLLIPPVLLCLLALTNDLHRLVYVPKGDIAFLTLTTDSYGHGPVFYLLYGWMIVSFLIGMALLLRKAGGLPRQVLVSTLTVTGIWLGLVLMHNLIFSPYHIPRMYNVPELHTFGMLGIFEICIRHRLIPGNINYPGALAGLRFSVLITDAGFKPVYYSGSELAPATEKLKAAVGASVHLTPDLLLSGRAIHGGYAFWAEDESAVHRAQAQLAEANELIEEENDLIRAETEQREKDAWLRSRHRIYHEVAEILYPCQRRIEALLGQMDPDAPDFRARLAHVSVLNAYVKRKSNLLLLAAERSTLTLHDLFLALQESARYLTLAGLQTNTPQPDEKGEIPAAQAVALYDAFEASAEQLLANASSLMVSWERGTLTLAAETIFTPDAAGLPVPARIRRVEDTLYLDLFAQKGGDLA